MKNRLTPFKYIKALGFVSFWVIVLVYCFRVGMQFVVIPWTNNFVDNTFKVVAYAPTILNPYTPKVHAEDNSIKPEETSEYEQISQYIRQVFGKDSDKAFTLLSCENSSLNPLAINTTGNYPVGSKDVGVFQINQYWQGVSNINFLYDWRINIDIAHNIYERDGNTFKLWSCGRKLGI